MSYFALRKNVLSRRGCELINCDRSVGSAVRTICLRDLFFTGITRVNRELPVRTADPTTYECRIFQ